MGSIKGVYFFACFRCICWIAVLSLVSYCIYNYTLNEDLCLVDYKSYFEDESDKRPVFSICLKDAISQSKLKKLAPQVDLGTYLGFLNGSHFNATLLDIDYKEVRLDISEYTVRFWSSWANGSYGYTREKVGNFIS